MCARANIIIISNIKFRCERIEGHSHPFANQPFTGNRLTHLLHQPKARSELRVPRKVYSNSAHTYIMYKCSGVFVHFVFQPPTNTFIAVCSFVRLQNSPSFRL